MIKFLQKQYKQRLEAFLYDNRDQTSVSKGILALSLVIMVIWGYYYEFMFREGPKDLWDHSLLLLGVAFFTAFIHNSRLTIMIVAEKLADKKKDEIDKYRNIIAPKWQNRGDLVVFWGLIYIVITGVYVLYWWSFGILVVTLFCLTSILKRCFVAKPMSKFIIMKLRTDLLNKKSEFDKGKDKVKSKEINDILAKFDNVCRSIICSK